MNKTILLRCLFGAAVLTAFLATEIVAVAAALIWVIATTFHPGRAPLLILSAIIGIGCLVLLAVIFRMAFESEVDLERR